MFASLRELHRQAALYSVGKNMSLNEFVRFAIDFTQARASGPGGAMQVLFCITLLLPALMN
jgi:hypothetical protein